MNDTVDELDRSLHAGWARFTRGQSPALLTPAWSHWVLRDIEVLILAVGTATDHVAAWRYVRQGLEPLFGAPGTCVRER